MWSQRFDGSGNLDFSESWGNNAYLGLNAPSIAVAIDALDVSGSESNYGWEYGPALGDFRWGDNNIDFNVGDVTLSGTNSSFKIGLGGDYYYFYDGQYYENGYQPNAAAISKITVQSMKYFPENYYANNVPGPGANEDTNNW